MCMCVCIYIHIYIHTHTHATREFLWEEYFTVVICNHTQMSIMLFLLHISKIHIWLLLFQFVIKISRFSKTVFFSTVLKSRNEMSNKFQFIKHIYCCQYSVHFCLVIFVYFNNVNKFCNVISTRKLTKENLDSYLF